MKRLNNLYWGPIALHWAATHAFYAVGKEVAFLVFLVSGIGMLLIMALSRLLNPKRGSSI
jgi:hypothetical protein